ncbi:hypothetical protein BDV98DRAFT_554139 [Pterulicium gracile]|uniref:deuterolysin n=1 Tax=Pterulicium gracile TaxID=1884261 RepID=A0A5C3QG51_9AGAR|nr:hypothetical protein BDV98DRAFT_554139 [Pterula gracilis]
MLPFSSLFAGALISLALVFARPGNLTVELTTRFSSSSVSSVDDIFLTAVISNPTTEDVKVVKLGSILDADAPTKSFKVKRGELDVPFTGITVRSPLYLSPATGNPHDDASYVLIPAGGSITVNHTVSALYDFSTAGPGTFTFTPLDDADWFLPSSAPSIDIEVTHDVERRYLALSDASSLSTPVCNDAKRKAYLAASLAEARSLAGGAAASIKKRPADAVYRSFFGNNNVNDVWYNFDRVAGDLASAGVRNLYCTDTPSPGLCSTNGYVAYTYGTDIWFCNVFFTGSVPTSQVCSSGAGLGSRGSIMLHELSHTVFGSDDVVYGCDGSKALGDADKKRNADNYSCYALQIRRSYGC